MIDKAVKRSNVKRNLFIFLGIILFILFDLFLINKYKLKQKELTVSQAKCKDCNVVFVAIDTLGATHLPCYGYKRNTAPKLCELASKAVFFKNAYSNSTWTLPSDISLFTGLYPATVGVMSAKNKLNNSKILFPAYLKKLGYNILFFAPKDDVAFPWDGVYDQLGDSFYSNRDYSWEDSIAMFKRNIKDGNKSFLYLHTYDVHSPYLIESSTQLYEPKNTKLPVTYTEFTKEFELTPEFAQELIANGKSTFEENFSWVKHRDLVNKYLEDLEAAKDDFDKQKIIMQNMRKDGLLWDIYQEKQNYTNLIDKNNPQDIEVLKALYDQMINKMDEKRMPLLNNLINDPLLKDNTILIIYSEHGEEFMEHGHIFHETLYEPNTKIPLIIYIPGVGSKTVEEAVQLADIVPTLVDILEIEPPHKFQGESLLSKIFGLDKKQKIVHLDGYDFMAKAYLYWPWKLYQYKQEDGKFLPFELYNVKEDPFEKNNLLFGNEKTKEEILKVYKKQHPEVD